MQRKNRVIQKINSCVQWYYYGKTIGFDQKSKTEKI